MFQFPSNGKAYLNSPFGANPGQKVSVFQFPSNGKAYLNKTCLGKQVKPWEGVSIPFKRESVSEPAEALREKRAREDTFQFPSNGKAYLNAAFVAFAVFVAFMFQFPSNGKAYLNV